jgi:hypothetical protein
LGAARRLASEHTRVLAFPRPQSDAALAHLVERLEQMSARDALTSEERAAMAGQAGDWLRQRTARDDTSTKVSSPTN